MTNRLPRFLAIGIAFLAVLSGCGRAPAAAPSTSPTSAAASARPAAVEVECVSIERAYKVWQEDVFRATTAAEFAEMDELTAERAVEYGKTFYDQVRGFDSQQSGALALAAAEYNAEVTLLRLQERLTGIKSEDAARAAAAVGKIEEAYAAWKAAVCS